MFSKSTGSSVCSETGSPAFTLAENTQTFDYIKTQEDEEAAHRGAGLISQPGRQLWEEAAVHAR